MPTVNEPLRDTVGGLLIVVPNGWLFQVMPASVQVAVDAKTSIVRHAAGTAVRYTRSVASRTMAVAGIAGLQVVRSKRR